MCGQKNYNYAHHAHASNKKIKSHLIRSQICGFMLDGGRYLE